MKDLHGMDERRSIGRILRERREERGLTPEQAAYQSKVPLRLLQILEADEYHLLPDPFYLIRFLYEYARLLQLDSSSLESEFRKLIRRPVKASLVAVSPPPAPPAILWRQLLWTAAAILVITPLVFIALSLASKRAAERSVPVQVAESPAKEPLPTSPPAPAASPAPSEGDTRAPADQLPGPGDREERRAVGSAPDEAPATSQKPSSAPEAVPSALPPPIRPAEGKTPRLLLTARALEPTWMVVRADGGQEREVLLQKGQTARFSAETGFVITVGNAGGVDLALNGVRVPSLGGSGQVVRNLTLPPIPSPGEAVEAVPPRPTPAPPDMQ